jgi:hypothetical protein
LETHSKAIEEAGTALNNMILQGEESSEKLTPLIDQCTNAIDAFLRASKHIKGFVVSQLDLKTCIIKQIQSDIIKMHHGSVMMSQDFNVPI